MLLLYGLCGGVAVASGSGELIEAGKQLWADKQLAQAEQQFVEAVKLEPASLEARHQLAALYLSQNRSRRAIEQYQEAITLAPERADLFMALALAYLHQQSYGAAQAMVAEALRLEPESKNAEKLGRYIETKLDQLKQVSAPPSGGDR